MRQLDRDLIDGTGHVPLLDDRLPGEAAEKCELLEMLFFERLLGPADEDVRYYADLPEDSRRLLAGLCLQLTGSPEVRDESQMHEHSPRPPHLRRELPDGLEERQ